MTIDELNALLEAITKEPSNDTLMLENFDKIRNFVKEINEKVASLTSELNKSKEDYSKLRESKVSDFFKNPDDGASEEVETEKEDNEEKKTTIKDLFEDGVEVEDVDEIKERDE